MMASLLVALLFTAQFLYFQLDPSIVTIDLYGVFLGIFQNGFVKQFVTL